ncbi:MAG: SusC/RagA family TonB-linked outer membrane protein [Proteiniphilum sp.]|jgi:iron complex outermembrane receptor protein|uniref:SusC/RagA family TonB-linked outer membrane protein n=1 Tax=Proteiniphilum sp. TaxID=1926877 RepID=UPI000925B288|nr:SusC/RagA family TonB-linked outer membrane protein [Proteiniphilum sp.]MEA5129641.1 SusC/RagA family TonB-linked outer membrane protein [Proteiniphilum sp.]OJV90852.1 MAG: SusC/RagA family TonB-linked outer membrane protein [Bacteroidia bacterium 44-10]
MKKEKSFNLKGLLFACMWIVSMGMFAQNITVSGTVMDVTNEPVIGATVVVQGDASHGTVTDIDGNYTLTNVPPNATLQFSYVGMTTQSIAVDGRTSIDVVLDSDTEMLDELVVTALGIRKDAKKLGYAVSNVSAADLMKTASPNLGSALYGKASGVRIQTAPGGLTGAISINVRGLSSITGTNQPLIIVDGVPIHNGDANTDGYWDNQRIQNNGLADINPEDIESLSVLKGASASALYGSEAANGVVMITTKSGRGASGFGVDFNASITTDHVAYMPKYQTTFGPGVRVGARAANGADADGWYSRVDRNGTMRQTLNSTTTYFGPKYDGRQVLYYDGTMREYSPINANPWNEVFRTGVTQQYNVAIVRGDAKGNTRLSYTYVDNLPTQYNSNFKKHNFNLNGSSNISESLKVDYAANYIITNIKNRPYRISRLTNNFGGMFGPFDDVKYLRESTVTSLGYKNQVYTDRKHLTPDEGYEWTPATYALVDEYFWHILAKEQLESNNRLIASVTPSWNIIDGLTLRARAATDLTVEKVENKENTEQSIVFGDYSGYYGLRNNRYEIFYGDIMLTYDTPLTDKFELTASAGWQGRTEKYTESKVNTEGGLTVENWFHLNASKRTKAASMDVSEFLKTAFFGTLSVGYNNWAFLEGTVRQEKISTLAPGNNSFFYPSVNSSFIFTELLKDKLPGWYDYGKVRASYGIVGNAPQIYKSTTGYEQNTVSGYIYNRVPVELGNENIKPEKKFEWEFGLESKFLANRLGFEASFYTNRVQDQILMTTMPSSSGAKGILMNVGELKNKGFELSLYGTPIETKDWVWDLRANLAINRNKVTKLAPGINTLQHRNEDNGSLFLYSKVGEPMGDFYSLAPATDENGNKIVRSDGFYKLTDEPVKVGNAMPKMVGGFATTLAYKNFALDASFDYRIGGAILNMPYQYLMGRGTLESSMKYRDAAHGGLTYYLDAGNNVVPFNGAQGPNGEKVYDNGMILKGVKEDGTPNDIMLGSDHYYNWAYNWGGWDPSSETFYSHSVFDNSYVKLRELSLTYNFENSFTSKFNCQRLSLSVYGRNLFYLYKNLPDFDAEAADGTTWITQSVLGGSTATTRSFGISLRATF